MTYATRRHYRTGCEVEARVGGIPCLVRVHYFYTQPATNAAPGYVDLGYEVCDRKGYRAPWLERKLTREKREQLEAQIIERLS